jgi:protein involved in polysaccharide export with SLBB domain
LRHARCNLVGAVLNHEPPARINNRFPRWLGCWLLCLALSPLKGKAAETNLALSAVNSPKRAAWQDRLTLGPGDILNFALFGQPELTRSEVPIGPDGRVSYLEADDVLASGLTIGELRAKLDEELAKYRRAPRTVITPAVFRSKKFFMLGTVARKGVFTLDRPLTIIEAVAQGRGLETGLFDHSTRELADLPRSFLARQGKRVPVDFEKLFQEGDLSQNIPLEPGDYLFFPPANLQEIYVLGEVRLPGLMNFNPGATALAAIATRGGFTERAWKKKILITRGSLHRPETFVVDAPAVLSARQPDFQLQPKDIVYISARPWIKAEELLDSAASAFAQAAVILWAGQNIGP